MPKQNWFDTLSEALDAENVAHLWDGTPVNYGETVRRHVDDGSKHGRVIAIYRHDQTGRYERPVTYRC
jgi:hypothetical protein